MPRVTVSYSCMKCFVVFICISKGTSLTHRRHRWRNWVAICIILRFRLCAFTVLQGCCTLSICHGFFLNVFFSFFFQTACPISSAIFILNGNCFVVVGILLNLAKHGEFWFIGCQLCRGISTIAWAHIHSHGLPLSFQWRLQGWPQPITSLHLTASLTPLTLNYLYA